MGCLLIISILCVSFLFNAVWSDCDRMKGPFGLTDCVRSPFSPKFQAAICLSKRMIEMSTSKRISCKGGNTKFCWYLCSATFTEGGQSVCKCDPGSKNQDKSDTPNVHCYFPKGGCSWYTKCLANKKDCPSIKKMENKCSELENISKKLSEKGYSFLKFMKSCLQKKLVHVLYPQVYTDCGTMKTKIELSTQMCLRESGNVVRYCDLHWGDIFKIGTLFRSIFNHLKICGSTPYLPPWAKILEFSLKGSSEKDIDYLANETGLTLSHSFKWNESGLSFTLVGPYTFNKRKHIIPIRIHLYSETRNYGDVEKAIKTVIDFTRAGKMVKLALKNGSSVEVTRVIGCSNPLCRPKHLFSLPTVLTSFKLPSFFHWHPWDIYRLENRWIPNLIDTWDRETQDSPIALLLGTMIVYDQQGKPRKPHGINLYTRKHVECTVLDQHFYPQKTGSTRRRKRNYLKGATLLETGATLWEKGEVPYKIFSGFSGDMIKAIQDAFNVLQSLTCIKLVELKPEHEKYIFLTIGDNITCSSFVGKQVDTEDNNQDVYLADPKCAKKTTVLHELMHVLGQVHEHSRTDRDDHVIIEEHVKENKNYRILDTNNETPYDVESVLHYPLSEDMKLKDSNLNFIVRTAESLSFYDVKEITLAYQCSALISCDNPPLCQNSGFLTHNCKCMCPDGLKGSTCNEVESDRDCGRIIDLKKNGSEEIKSPNYPSAYRTNMKCVWMIRGPENSNIRLTIIELDLRMNTEGDCYHWLEIRYNLVGQTGIRRCNNPSPQKHTEYTTTDFGEKNVMILTFDSKISKGEMPHKNQRFFLKVKAV